VPFSYNTKDEWPLVVLLHGYGGTGFIQDAYLGISARVDEDGFILVIPEGTTNAQGKQYWNATDACCDFYFSGVDDVTYLKGLINEAKEKLSIDSKRVYLMGHSNGGFMSYRMACEASEMITGIASLAGSDYLSDTTCPNSEAVSILQIHGTEDGTISYDGSEYYPSAPDVVERWRTRNNCGAFKEKNAIGIERNLSGNETAVQSISECDKQTSVELWTIQGGSHIPAVDSEFSRLTLEFLLRHEKP
jgi:polyhydroxybutyrate depolymerase